MGYKYFTSQRESRKAAKAWDREQAAESPDEIRECEIDTAPTPKTQREWMRLFKHWGSHPDNG